MYIIRSLSQSVNQFECCKTATSCKHHHVGPLGRLHSPCSYNRPTTDLDYKSNHRIAVQYYAESLSAWPLQPSCSISAYDPTSHRRLPSPFTCLTSFVQPFWPRCLQAPLNVNPGQVQVFSSGLIVYSLPLEPFTLIRLLCVFTLNGLGVIVANFLPLLSNPLIGFLK